MAHCDAVINRFANAALQLLLIHSLYFSLNYLHCNFPVFINGDVQFYLCGLCYRYGAFQVDHKFCHIGYFKYVIVVLSLLVVLKIVFTVILLKLFSPDSEKL